MFICFAGIDGSGKTLQAERLVESLSCKGVMSSYVWCRYNPRVLRPVTELSKLLIRKKKGGSEYTGYMASKKGILKNPILGPPWLSISLREYLSQAKKTINTPLARGQNLVADRYISDMLADLSVSLDRSGAGILELIRHPIVSQFPVPDITFFLDVPPLVAYARKNDPNVMGKQYLIDRAKIYSYLSDNMGFTRIDGTLSIDEIADFVLKETMALVEARRRRGTR